jgi:hypothetical protein
MQLSCCYRDDNKHVAVLLEHCWCGFASPTDLRCNCPIFSALNPVLHDGRWMCNKLHCDLSSGRRYRYSWVDTATRLRAVWPKIGVTFPEKASNISLPQSPRPALGPFRPPIQIFLPDIDICTFILLLNTDRGKAWDSHSRSAEDEWTMITRDVR